MKAFETLESETAQCRPSKGFYFGRKSIYFLFPSSMKTNSGKPNVLILADTETRESLNAVMTVNPNSFSLDHITLPVICFLTKD